MSDVLKDTGIGACGHIRHSVSGRSIACATPECVDGAPGTCLLFHLPAPIQASFDDALEMPKFMVGPMVMLTRCSLGTIEDGMPTGVRT
jgi:hypothetical protein